MLSTIAPRPPFALASTLAHMANGVFSKRLLALTLGLVLTVSITALEALAVATVLPAALREIGGLSYYGWAFTGFMLANLIGIPLSGRVVDRFGPVPPFIAGVVLFTVGILVSGLSPSFAVLVVGRVLQGAGAAPISSVSYVVIARAYDKDLQPRMMALLSSAWVIPGLFGPAIAALVGKLFGWRMVFLGLLPITIAASLLAFAGLRGIGPPPQEPQSQGSRPPRSRAAVGAAVLLVLGVSLALLGVRIQSLGLALAVGLAGGGLALLALRRLLPPGTLLARSGLPAAIAVLALAHFGFFAVEAFLPLALTELRKAGTWIIAACLTAATLAWTVGSWIEARTAGRLARRTILHGGLALLVVGMIATSLVLLPSVPPYLAVLSWGVVGLGMGMAFQAATLAVLGSAPTGREGEVTAQMQIANALAVAVGTGLGGDLLTRWSTGGQPSRLGLWLVDAAAIAAALICLWVARRISEPPARAESASG